jgi:hypothetical protein
MLLLLVVALYVKSCSCLMRSQPPSLTDGSPGGSYYWDQVMLMSLHLLCCCKGSLA